MIDGITGIIFASPLSLLLFIIGIIIGWLIADEIKKYYQTRKSKEVEE